MSTLDQAHAMLVNKYDSEVQVQAGLGVEGLVPIFGKLLDDPVYARAYRNAKKTIRKKGERTTKHDPQANTVADSYTMADYAKMVDHWLGQSKGTADRFLSMASWMHSSVGRGDECRGYYLPDFMAPMLVPSIGKSHL
jgi:hypothetical protein